MPASKDLRKLVTRVERAGWDIKRMADGHYRVRPPEGYGAQMFLSTMSGDVHTYDNMRQKLKRAGFFEYESAYLNNHMVELASENDLLDVPLPQPLPLPTEMPMRPAPKPQPTLSPTSADAAAAAPPPARPSAERRGPDEFTVGLIKLGRMLARLPLDKDDLDAVRALIIYAEGLGLTLSDVRSVLEVEAD